MTGQAALRRCAGDQREFLAEYWARRPLLRRARDSGENFSDLLDLADVDVLVTSSGLRAPAFRLIQDGSSLPVASYTTTPRIGGVAVTGLADPAKILAAIDAGATLVLQSLHRYWPPVSDLCRGLESTLGHSCQANAYFTPPGARGLAEHSDPHDVFVLQAFGCKRWEIQAPDGPWDVVLEPGDALYLPTGTPHAATAQDTLSGHITVGILTESWRQLLTTVVGDVLADAAFAERLPAGWQREPDRFATELSARLDDLRARLDKASPAEIARARADHFLTCRSPALAGALVDRVRLGALDDDTMVRRRAGAICHLRPVGDRLVLLLGDRSLTVPGGLAATVEQLASGEPTRVGDLELDASSRLVLVRRLVREGLLEVAE